MGKLYEIIEAEFGKTGIAAVPVPNHITGNLREGLDQRRYQQEAFQRFLLCYSEAFAGKPQQPYHFLFNMATGSGKTLIMAGLMLHLYQQGYRNFLFFVNSNNIIRKTKDNFLNATASKYLFRPKIVIDGHEVQIREVENFEESADQNIHIKFTTIQQLHVDLNNARENGVTFEDFKNKKLVLIADEAHHLVAGTRSGRLEGSWEDTVKKIHESNPGNILLEFTATIDTETAALVAHYQDKVIFRYDLAEFRKDKYSKEINLVRSMYDEADRIIQALILNLYRQELAALNGINLKPVILFKAKRTILESEKNKENFHRLIEDLTPARVGKIQKTSTVPIVQKAFRFFRENQIAAEDISRRLKANFRFENCLSANNDTETEQNQIALNTLEDSDNPIRAIFAVQKLNEGWDVLNLFDIVRLYESGQSGGNKLTGSTTLSEAQLIGRGARYFPFTTDHSNAHKFTRKFDDEPFHQLKILEELYYHTKEDSRYISDLKRALIHSGIYEDENDFITKQLLLKPEFKKSSFYREGQVILNQKTARPFEEKSFPKISHSHRLSSGEGLQSGAFSENQDHYETALQSKIIKLSAIPPHILRYALSRNPFFYFANLSKYFPNLNAVSTFIRSRKYLGGLEIKFSGTAERLDDINPADYLQALHGLLEKIANTIKRQETAYKGSELFAKAVCDVFKDKELRIPKSRERSDSGHSNLANVSWYAYSGDNATIHETPFLEWFATYVPQLNKKFKNIFLIRNEKQLKIYDRNGQAFVPGFVLICQQRSDEQITYQVMLDFEENSLPESGFIQADLPEKHVFRHSSGKQLITTLSLARLHQQQEWRKALDNALHSG